MANSNEVKPDALGVESEEEDQDFDFADYEEEDAGLELTSAEAFVKLEDEETDDYLLTGNLTPEAWLDEDFEKELGSASQELSLQEVLDTDYGDIAKLGIVQVAGEDRFGRRLITFNSCRLPDVGHVDHEQLLSYIKQTLEQYVMQDYALIYFHRGLTRLNRPSLSFIIEAYQAFGRNFKKNLKALYLVHRSIFLRLLLGVFQPLISDKFDRKVVHIDSLEKLNRYVFLDKVPIPQRVRNYDMQIQMELQLMRATEQIDACQAASQLLDSLVHFAEDDGTRNKRLMARKAAAKRNVKTNLPKPVPSTSGLSNKAVVNKSQFGMSLEEIRRVYQISLAPILVDALNYIQTQCLYVQDLFRRTTDPSLIQMVKQKYDHDDRIDFFKVGDPHLAAVMTKLYLQSLPAPLIPYPMFNDIIRIYALSEKVRLEETKKMINERLKEENYYVLKYIMSVLLEVSAHSEENRMTIANLAFIFGSILIWSKRPTNVSLVLVTRQNAFVEMLLNKYDEIFEK